MNRQTQHNLLFLAGLTALTFLCLYLAAVNLANYHPVSGDDGWIMSASYKLASEGVFGSDIYAGFFNADRHYFIALPVYHFLQAISFRLMGFGVFQARLPNLFSALLLIWLTAALAKRHHGRKTALLAATLLIFLCPNPSPIEPCNMLLIYAHNGRYDLTATTFAWAAVWLLDTHVHRPRPGTAFALGLTAALATLTQFFGVFILLPVALIFLFQSRKRPFRQHPLLPFSAGFLILVGPYLAYILANLDDFIGQSFLKSGRLDLLNPRFYLDNILHEPARFQAEFPTLRNLFSGQLIGILFFAASLAAIVFILRRLIRRPNQKAPTTFWLSFFCFIIGLTLFENIKAPVYSIILLPGICLALAVISGRFFQYLYHLKWPSPLRLITAAPVLIFLAFLLISGLDSASRLLKKTREATPYLSLGHQIESAVNSDGIILGTDNWWPALEDHPYLAINDLWTQWRSAEANGRSPQFTNLAAKANVQYILINYDIFGNFPILTEPLDTQFWGYLTTCATLHAQWQDPNYGRIQLYQAKSTSNCSATTPTN